MEDAPKQTYSRRVWWLVGGAIAFTLVASAAIWFAGPKVWTDGGTIRLADRDTKVREVIWTPPRPLDGFASDEQVYEPSISPDGTELYFVRGKAGGNAKIYVSHRRNNAWIAPAPVDAVNGPFDSLGPRVSPDGNLLFFYSNRPGGFGGYDIWAAPRAANGWGKPFNLGPHVNSEFNEFNPDPTPDGRHLIFSTNRRAARREQNEAWRSTIRETVSSDYDLWIADTEFSPPATTQPFAPIVRPAREIADINTSFTEGASCMSPAGDFLYFASNRPGGQGKFDIYRSRVHDGVFTPAENIGKPINSAENEVDPALAYNGFRMILSSDRPGADGRYHLLFSDSREVYSEHQARAFPTLGWSWWLLIASLLVLVPLLLMMRGWDDRRFSLIQKCLLMSLLVHAFVTFILSFVAVTQKVTQYVRKEMQLEVAVNLGDSRGVEETLAVRGQVSGDLPISSPQPPSLEATKIATETLQASAPMAIDAPVLRATPGGITILVDSPRLGVPAPSEPAAQVAAAVGLIRMIDVAPPQPRQVAQSESAPKLSDAQASSGHSASTDTTTPLNSTAANLQLPSTPAAAGKTSDVALASARILSAGSVPDLGNSSPKAQVGTSAQGPQVATDGHLPPVGRTAVAEPVLTATNAVSAPTTRPIMASTSSEGAAGAGPIALESTVVAGPSNHASPLTPPVPSHGQGISTAALASAIQPRIDAGAREVDQPRPVIDAGGKVADKTGGSVDSTPAMAAAPSGKSLASAEPPSSAPPNLNLSGSKIPAAAVGAGSLTAAAPTHFTAPGTSGRSQGAVVLPTASSQLAGPEIGGPHIADSLKVVGNNTSGVEKPISAGTPAIASSPLQGSAEHGVAHAIDIAPAPVLAAGKVPAGGRGGLGMGGAPTARPEIASTHIQPEISLSALTGPLGPGKSVVPDLTVIRAPEQRKPMLEQFGGTKESEDAVARALAWLAHVQEEDGRWTRIDGEQFNRRRGRGQHDMACTSLALLAFLGHDETPDKPGPYKDVVSKAVDYLISQQDEEGDLRGPPRFRGGGADSANMYDQGIATYALAECAIMTRDPRVMDAAIKGAKFIVASQDPQSGGWRYSPQEHGDSSVFGWQIMALHSAQQLGFEIPQDTLDNAKRYIKSCGQGRYRLLAGYQPHTSPTTPMTAETLFSRMLLEMPLEEDGIDEATRFLARDPPEIQRADLYYWYYASLSMLHMQNPLWKDWNVLTRESLIRMQQDDGGWDSNIKWGERGGRVFTTSLATLTLEVYYRYLPLRKAPPEATTPQMNTDEHR